MRRVWPLCEGEGADLGPDIKIIPRVFRIVSETSGMPMIDVTFDGTVGEEVLRRLAGVLPDAVAEAVDCPEDPWTGRRDRVT